MLLRWRVCLYASTWAAWWTRSRDLRGCVWNWLDQPQRCDLLEESVAVKNQSYPSLSLVQGAVSLFLLYSSIFSPREEISSIRYKYQYQRALEARKLTFFFFEILLFKSLPLRFPSASRRDPSLPLSIQTPALAAYTRNASSVKPA